MSLSVNRAGADWLLIKRWAEKQIGELHLALEADQDEALTNRLRGEIRTLRLLIETVEPPPSDTPTIEDKPYV